MLLIVAGVQDLYKSIALLLGAETRIIPAPILVCLRVICGLLVYIGNTSTTFLGTFM